ncbi:MAG: hypothetical protein ACK54C_03670 [Betaproteobacteria bacterium]
MHLYLVKGQLATTLARHIDRIGHIRLADGPARRERDTGEINDNVLFAHLGWLGWMRCALATTELRAA